MHKVSTVIGVSIATTAACFSVVERVIDRLAWTHRRYHNANTRGTIRKIEVLRCRANRYPRHLFRGLTWARIRKGIHCIQLDPLPPPISPPGGMDIHRNMRYVKYNMILWENRDSLLNETAVVLIWRKISKSIYIYSDSRYCEGKNDILVYFQKHIDEPARNSLASVR